MNFLKKKETPGSVIGRIAMEIGKGLIAGAAGTAAITLSQTIEMKITGRQPSEEPADAAEKALDIKPESPEDKEKFSQEVHWTYGTLWGIPRSILGAMGLNSLTASAIHFATIYTAALVVPAELKVAPPAKDMKPETLAIDGLHHLVYAVAAGLVYDALSKYEN